MIEMCPYCSSRDIEDCASNNPEVMVYYCNGCHEYFDIYDLMP